MQNPITSLITTCCLVTTSAALGCGGAPITHVEPTPRPSMASGGFQAEQPRVEGWVLLGAPVAVTPIQHTITVAGQGGNIAQLLVKGVSGESEIAQITIEYMDKQVKRVDLQRKFLPGDGQVIELKADRPIDKIIVFLDPDSKGTFEIFGA
ncbi:MAG: hypothetical protein H0X17_16250 [Deltaproteobacteria bacterium]|nr:hypothetical protein [Deltaproteobacteria bacterium]